MLILMMGFKKINHKYSIRRGENDAVIDFNQGSFL